MDPMSIQALMQMMQQMSAAAQGGGYSLGQGDVGGFLSGMGQYNPIMSGVGGFLSGRRAKKKEKKLKKNIENTRLKTESIFGKGLAQQEALSRQATGQELAGYDTARKETARLGRASKQRALDSESQLGARLSQGLADRGLGSTTVGPNLQRGLAADTSRQFQGIDEGMAQMFGNLALGRSQVESQGTQSLADLAGQRTNFDINNAQFWLPQQMARLGQFQGLQMGGGQVGGGPSGGMGGIDMNALMQLFGQGGFGG